MHRRVMRRPRRAHLATALLRRKLDPSVMRVVGELVDELKDHGGELAPSSLFSVRVIRSTLKHARYVIARNPAHGLLLAHLATLLVPHLNAQTPYEAQRTILLEGDAYRLYAAGLLRCGRNYDAKRAADESRRLFHIPIVRKLSGKHEAKLDITAGQILFNLGEVDRGLAMIAAAADKLNVIHADTRLFLTGRSAYGGLLMFLRRWEEAAMVFDELLEIANESNHREVTAAISYNIAICGKRLQEEHADQCHASAMKLLEKIDMTDEAGRSEWVRVIELQQQGKANEAISEMYKIRAKYFDEELEVRGHDEISPNIVDALMAEGRDSEARRVGDEAMEKLAAAGMKRSEMRIRRALYGPSAASG